MSDEFLGRVLENEMEFQYCDICGQDGVNWLQVRDNEVGQKVVRFLCRKCHDQLSLETPNVVRSINDPEEIERRLNMEWGVAQEQEATPATVELGSSGGSNWSASFIQEALFGQDPVAWLEKQGAFAPERIGETVEILMNLAASQINPVKIAVIKCLGAMQGKNEAFDPKIREALQHFANLPDTDLSTLASQYLQ
ncbi:MAG: hypothetical protein D6732_19090 [Methanobacteriota archaeon]|nr:MAG: hypothetical protein D6732_19090 [Euryarchaeota archaeon]